VDDLRCRKHGVPLVPNGQGDWGCEKADNDEGVCDSITLADVLSRVNNILGFVTYNAS
jgi:hypothetical protein